MSVPTYCKAYMVEDLRGFAGWKAGLAGDEICYIWSDYVVSRGCFDRSETVPIEVTPEWQAFCRNTLKFDPREEDRAESPA